MKEKFKVEIETIAKIILQAQEDFLIVKYLSKEETDSDVHYEKKMNSFFHYSRVAYWQLTVIELSKLFLQRGTERFNLVKFLRKLRPDGVFRGFKISNEKIDDWENRILAQQDDIDNLRLQRDKVYVHTDSDNEEINNQVSFERTDKLLTISREIVKEVYITCYDSGYSFDLIGSPVENLKFCIERLTKEKKAKMEGYRNLAKKYDLEDELPKK